MVDWGNHPFLLAVWRSRYTTSAVQLTRRSSSQNGQSIPRGAPLFITFERSTKNSSTILHIYPNDTAGHEIVHHLLPQKKWSFHQPFTSHQLTRERPIRRSPGEPRPITMNLPPPVFHSSNLACFAGNPRHQKHPMSLHSWWHEHPMALRMNK